MSSTSWWKRDADVLYPPIATAKLRPAPERERLMLSVGRFFSPGLGHAKRQLEMVQWFGEMHRAGRLPGWRFAVVGGCEPSQLPYLAQVEQAAEGPAGGHPSQRAAVGGREAAVDRVDLLVGHRLRRAQTISPGPLNTSA